MSIAADGALITIADLPDPLAYDAFHPFLRGVFSQWHPTSFELEGHAFNTAEQWMMFAKARLFGDDRSESAILRSTDPAEQKRLGQNVEAFDQSIWDRHKLDIVLRGNIAKFTQNPGAARQLGATRHAMLVEANPRDWIWGCGLAADNPMIQSPKEWPGENLLGRVLTHVREMI